MTEAITDDKNCMYEDWLARLPGIGSKKKKELRELAGDAKRLFNIEETPAECMELLDEKERAALKKHREIKEEELLRNLENMEKEQIHFIPYYSPEFPERLLEIPASPYGIYRKGKLPDPDRLAVAIVGARRCSGYGESMALQIGEMLADCGAEVISGLARGIDSMAQRGALNGGGHTYAVLGCGADICYPRENIGLYQDILNSGGILSEYCPGTAPLRTHFPARNRIISGLADVVLVLEAKEKSGSLITADMALEQGRDVFALPGPITNPMSKGCNNLIRQGAGVIAGIEELMEDLNLAVREKKGPSFGKEKKLETTENMVYSYLDLFPKGLGQLEKETGLSVDLLMEALINLQMDGLIREFSKNNYVRL